MMRRKSVFRQEKYEWILVLFCEFYIRHSLCNFIHQNQDMQSFFLYHSAILLIFNHWLSAHPTTFYFSPPRCNITNCPAWSQNHYGENDLLFSALQEPCIPSNVWPALHLRVWTLFKVAPFSYYIPNALAKRYSHRRQNTLGELEVVIIIRVGLAAHSYVLNEKAIL